MNLKYLMKSRVFSIIFLHLLVVQFLLSLNQYAFADKSRQALVEMSQKVHFHTLSNGIRVISLNKGMAPVFSAAVVVKVGGINEQPGHTGISHLLEHMAFKGTPKIGTKDYSKEKALLAKLEDLMTRTDLGEGKERELKEVNAQLKDLWDQNAFSNEMYKRGGVDLNASTETDVTNYYVSLPNSSLEYWFWLESERILNPVMRGFYQERDVVLEERRMRFEDSPTGKIYQALLSLSFVRHPYGRPVIGTKEDLERVTANETLRFQKEHYVGSNIVIALVGDLDSNQVEKLAEKYFGRISSKSPPSASSPLEPPQHSQREVKIDMTSSPVTMIGYRKPVYPNPDDVVITVVAEMLAGSKTSPLYDELVRKQRLATDVGNFEAPGNLGDNLSVFMITQRQGVSMQTMLRAFDQVISQETASIAKDKVALRTAKKAISRSYLDGMMSNPSLALDLAKTEVLYGDWWVILRWYDDLMRVTGEDVARIMEKYFSESTRNIAYIE